MHANLLIVNGKCLTMKNRGTCDWIAVKNDTIMETGKGKDYLPLVCNSTVIIDAEKNTVLPGFIDSHFHVVQTAMNNRCVQMNTVKNFEDIGYQIEQAEALNPKYPIIGVRLQRETLSENTFPSRKILDRYSENVPIWINCLDYQVSMLNTYGLLYYKIPFRMEGIEMDKNGVATGIFRGRANATLRTNVLNKCTDKFRQECVTSLIPDLLSVGITTVNAMEGGYMYSDLDAEFIYKHSKDYPIDITLFYQSMDMQKIKKMGLKRVGGSLYLDGTMGARTAALTFEYADAPGKMGDLVIGQTDLNEFLVESYKNHWQTALYAIGDRAIEQALRGHEYALDITGISGLRHRIEHVELATHKQIKKAKELGIIFSMNPTYERYWGAPNGMYQRRLGNRYGSTNQFRDIIDSGVVLCAGSDSDICEINPLIGISSAINHPIPQHRISLYEALEMYTINGAYAIKEEHLKGTLEKGKLADIIIMDKDIPKLSNDKVDTAKVTCTIKSGQIIYNKLSQWV